MSDGAKYIFIRINAEKKAEIVNSCESIKDANYWLNYIAEPGDAMFITASHPKHGGGNGPEYHSHLISRRNVGRDQDEWRAIVKLESNDLSQIFQAAP